MTTTTHEPSRACYLRGCRKPECITAHTKYGNTRKRLLAYGKWEPFTDAQPVRDHVLALLSTGLAAHTVGIMAGVEPASVHRLVYGSKGQTQRRIRHDAAAKLLAVRRTPPAHGKIDSTGTIRRIQALMARGWYPTAIAAKLGQRHSNFRYTLQRDHVYATTAAAVREMYDALWNASPPSATPRQRAWSRRAMELAERNGWPPPMAWDDDVIDLPDGKPAEGWQRQNRSSSAVLADEVRELMTRQGYTLRDAAERLGKSKSAVEQALSRSPEAAA